MEGKLCPILPLRCFLSYRRLLIERFQVLKAVLRPALLISKQLSAAEADTLVYNQRWAIGNIRALVPTGVPLWALACLCTPTVHMQS